MVKKMIRSVSLSVFLTIIITLSLAVFIKSLDVLFNDFFVQHAKIIAIVSGLILGVFLITGFISFRRVINGSKTIIPK